MNHAPESKKLTVKLIKVKDHVDDGNIQVDALAKEGSINGMVIKPHLLLTHLCPHCNCVVLDHWNIMP